MLKPVGNAANLNREKTRIASLKALQVKYDERLVSFIARSQLTFRD